MIVLVALATSALPGLGQLRSHLAHADPAWVAAAAAAEVGSCAGYVLVFRDTFCARMAWGLSSEIALAEQAANSLLPAGGAGGLALGAWALHQAGMPTDHIGRRTVAFFVVTSAANFLGVILAGIATFSGVLPGSRSVLFALIPALLALLVTLLVAVSPQLLRRLGASRPAEDRGWGHRIAERLRGLLTGVADGVDQALALLHAASFGVVVGSFSYMAFDLAALGCAFAATSHLPAIATLLLGYLVGQLGNLIPMPGGVGGTEAGLVGMSPSTAWTCRARPRPSSSTVCSNSPCPPSSGCPPSSCCVAGYCEPTILQRLALRSHLRQWRPSGSAPGSEAPIVEPIGASP